MKQILAIVTCMAILVLAGCRSEAPAPVEERAAPPDPGQPIMGRQTFAIVPAESTASYMVDEEFFGLALSKYGIPAGMGKAIGSTQAIEGEFELDPDNLQAPVGRNTFTIRMNTFKSDRPSRDEFLREDGPRFDDHPAGTFSATRLESAERSIRSGGEVEFRLAGNLTVREISKPVVFEVKARLNGATLIGEATAQLKMTDFGIDPPSFANTLTASNDFQIEVRFTARASAR